MNAFNEQLKERFDTKYNFIFSLPLNDFSINSNLRFNDGKMCFSSISNFNLKGFFNSNHTLKLKHSNKDYYTEITQESDGKTTLNHFGSYIALRNLNLGLSTRIILDHGEYNNEISSSLHFIAKHFGKSLSIGAENVDPFKKEISTNFSGNLSFEKKLKSGLLTFNLFSRYNNLTKFMSHIKFSSVYEGNSTNALIEVVSNFELNDEDQINSIVHSPQIFAKLSHVFNDITLGGSLLHDINSKENTYQLMFNHKMDNINLLGGIDNDRKFKIGIKSSINGVELNLALNGTHKFKTIKQENEESTNHWIESGFSIGLDFSKF